MSLDTSVEFGVSVLEDIIKAGYKALQKKRRKKNSFKVEAQKYVKGMINRYGKVKVLTQREPTDLMRLYVRANIIEKITARVGGEIKELEEFFDLEKRSFYNKLEIKDGEEIANKLQKFIVLGKPGAGKTTFLRYIALAMLHKKSVIKNRRLPIFVTLRDWADKKTPLLHFLAAEFDVCGFANAQLFVQSTLQQGNCLVLFDGLDEVSQDANLDGIIREIRDFTDKYGDNQFIISCRIAAYNHWFEQYTDVEMADFNSRQIATFVKNWFTKEPEVGRACLNELNSSKQLKELATAPLLLTLMCITYHDDYQFPRNRADLYERAIEALLTKWDASRRIRRDDTYGQLSFRRKKELFTAIAFETFLNDKYFFSGRELLKMIENFILDVRGFKIDNLHYESKEVLKSIEIQHGIFVERARNIYSFNHLTIQEYFTAKFLIEISTNNFFSSIIDKLLYEDKWLEVTLLSANMLPKSKMDRLLKEMARKNRQVLKHKVFRQFLENVQELLLPHPNEYAVVIREAIGMVLILDRVRIRIKVHSLDQALDRALGISLDRIQILVRGIKRVLNQPQKNPDKTLNIARARSIAMTLALDLDRVRDLQQLLQQFLKSSSLIIQCLNTDCLVSQDLRQEILDRLLKPLSEEEKREMGVVE